MVLNDFYLDRSLMIVIHPHEIISISFNIQGMLQTKYYN